MQQDPLQGGLSCKWTYSILVAPNYALGGKGRDLRRLNSEEREITDHLWGTAVKGKKSFSLYYFSSPAELSPGNMTLSDMCYITAG